MMKGAHAVEEAASGGGDGNFVGTSGTSFRFRKFSCGSRLGAGNMQKEKQIGLVAVQSASPANPDGSSN